MVRASVCFARVFFSHHGDGFSTNIVIFYESFSGICQPHIELSSSKHTVYHLLYDTGT